MGVGAANEPAVITCHPGYRFGRPTVGGISCEAVAEVIAAGEDVPTVMDEYGLTRDQVILACWFESQYGRTGRRRKWKTWGDDAHLLMWNTKDWSHVPDPPSNEELKARG